MIDLPRPPKECFLVGCMYLKTFMKHTFGGLGMKDVENCVCCIVAVSGGVVRGGTTSGGTRRLDRPRGTARDHPPCASLEDELGFREIDVV